jgi:hypothetical protein
MLFLINGLFAIVPDLPKRPSAAVMALWNVSSTKEFKVRIIDPSHPMLHIGSIKSRDGVTWTIRPVQFRNSFRPRARYLYYHYCTQVLRLGLESASS